MSRSVSGVVHFTGTDHPFGPREMRTFAPGMTIDEMLAQAGVMPEPGAPLAVRVDGNPLHVDEWDTLQPGAGSLVEATHVPQVSAIFFSILGALGFTSVSSALAGGLAGLAALAVAGIGTLGVVVGVSLALSFTVQAIVGTPEQDNFDQLSASPTFTGTSNRAWRNRPTFLTLGRHRVMFPYAALPYTELQGATQFLRSLFHIGDGEYDIELLKIGETDLSTFESVDYNYYDGSAATPTLVIFPTDVKEESVNVQFNQRLVPGQDPETEPFLTHEHTLTQQAEEITLDFVFPQGVQIVADGGRRVAAYIELEIEIQRQDPTPGSYLNINTFASTEWELEGLELEEVGAKYRIGGLNTRPNNIFSVRFRTPARGDYQVRVKGYAFGTKVSPRNTPYFQRDRGGNGSGLSIAQYDVVWNKATAYLNEDPVNLENQALLEMRIKASEQLSGVVEEFNGVITSKVEAWNGSSFDAAAASRNPAWHALHVLRNVVGIPDSRIDLAAYKALADKCEPTPGTYVYTHDRVFDFDTDAQRVLRDILSTCFATPYLSDGVHTLVIDEERSTPAQHFSPRNVHNFQWSRAFIDRPHAIRTKFLNPAADWVKDELVVYDDGYGIQAADTTSISMSISGGLLTRSIGSFLVDGFSKNSWLNLTGSSAADGYRLIKAVTALQIEFYDAPADEGAFTGQAVTLEATQFETVELPGTTRLPQAWRHGRRLFALGTARPDTFSFDVDWEYLSAEFGDMVLVSHYTLQVGTNWGRVHSTVVVGGNVTELVLDGPVTYVTGEGYAIAARGSDNTTYQLAVDNLFDDEALLESTRIKLTTPVVEASAPGVGDLVTFGKTGEVTEEAVIVGVQPLENLRGRVFLQPHAGAELTALENEAIIDDSESSIILPEATVPRSPLITDGWLRFDYRNTERERDVELRDLLGGRTLIGLSWSLAFNDTGDGNKAAVQRFEVQFRLGEQDDPDVPWDPDADPEYPNDNGGWISAGAVPASSPWTYEFLPPPEDVLDAVFGNLGSAISQWFSQDTEREAQPPKIQVRIRSLSAFGVASAWTSAYDIAPMDDTLSPPEDVNVFTTLEVTDNGTEALFGATWVSDPDVAYYNVRLVEDINETADASAIRTLGVKRVPNSSSGPVFTLKGVPFGVYRLIVTPLDARGAVGVSHMSIVTYNPNDTARVLVPAPSGFQVNNQGAEQEVCGCHYFLSWNPVLVNPPHDLGDPDLPADSDGESLQVAGYLLRFFDEESGVEKRQEFIEGTSFNYSLAMQQEDGGPYRRMRITCQAKDVRGILGSQAVVRPYNPPTGLPILLSAEPHLGGVQLEFHTAHLQDPDWDGRIDVWATDGLTFPDSQLDDDHKVFSGTQRPVQFTMPELGNRKVLIRWAAVDAHGEVGLIYSSAVEVGIKSLVDSGDLVPASHDNLIFDPSFTLADLDRFTFVHDGAVIDPGDPDFPFAIEDSATVFGAKYAGDNCLTWEYDGTDTETGGSGEFDLSPVVFFAKDMNDPSGKIACQPGDVFYFQTAAIVEVTGTPSLLVEMVGAVLNWYEADGAFISRSALNPVPGLPLDGVAKGVWGTGGGRNDTTGFPEAPANAAYVVPGLLFKNNRFHTTGPTAGDKIGVDALYLRRTLGEGTLEAASVSQETIVEIGANSTPEEFATASHTTPFNGTASLVFDATHARDQFTDAGIVEIIIAGYFLAETLSGQDDYEVYVYVDDVQVPNPSVNTGGGTPDPIYTEMNNDSDPANEALPPTGKWTRFSCYLTVPVLEGETSLDIKVYFQNQDSSGRDLWALNASMLVREITK